jgi:hypothetical protein
MGFPHFSQTWSWGIASPPSRASRPGIFLNSVDPAALFDRVGSSSIRAVAHLDDVAERYDQVVDGKPSRKKRLCPSA